MSGFILPVKEIIVNDDSQVRLLDEAGAAYTALKNNTPTTGGFQLEGFLSAVNSSALQLLKAATRIIKDTPSAGAAEVKTFTVTSTSSPADAVFRIMYESLDLTPVEFQNQRQEKRYQISAAQASAATIGPKIAAVINADKFAPVTASAAGAVVTLTAKQKGVKFNLYSTDFAGTEATTTPAALPLNTYDYLKNINWAKNVDFDRNLNWNPLPGISYNSYYFEILSDSVAQLGHSQVPGEKHAQSLNGFKLWVKTGLALDTALTDLAADMNV
jgi:hypothetical protein